MLETIIKNLLEVYEHEERCLKLRELIINDQFEANVKDYEMACRAVNNIANEYFKTGFEYGISLITEIIFKNQN